MPLNLYDILGIPPDASHQAIRDAYYIRVRVIHPDRFDPVKQRKEWDKANEMLAELNAAYATLRNPARRREYDEELGYERKKGSSASDDTRHNVNTEANQPSEERSWQSPEANEQHSQKSATPSTGPTRLRFSILPTAVQQRLLARQRGLREQLALRTDSLKPELALLGGALIWIGILFYSSNDYRWSENLRLAYAGVTIAAVILISIVVVRFMRWKNSPMKGFIFITPLYFIKTRFDQVSYWGIWQIAAVNPVNHYTNGSYTYTTVAFVFDEGAESIRLNSLASVHDLFDKLKRWGTRNREAAKTGDWEYFKEQDDFFEIHGNEKTDLQPKERLIKRLLFTTAWGLLGGFALALGADQLNQYIDDRRSWEDAAAINRVGGYRKYLVTHPSGAWIEEANKRIEQQYDTSASNYRRSLSTGFDQKASEALLGVLTYIKRTQNYRVRVVFERLNEIPTNLEERLKEEFGVTSVLSMGDAFSEEKMRAREQEIITQVASAFKEVIPEDILEIVGTGAADSKVVLVIRYKVRAGKSLYFRDVDSHISAHLRNYYPGVYLTWDFEIRVPEQRGYRFSLESNPASTISYRSASNLPDSSTVYDRMTSSAFENFRDELIRRLGLRERHGPTPDASETASASTPIPNVYGTYRNDFGTVDVFGSGEGFSFDVDVATARCNGSMTGKANWLKNRTAIFRTIAEAENPESFYYKKVCQLTFRFSEDEVQISQTDACSYFHGAECSFIGSYYR